MTGRAEEGADGGGAGDEFLDWGDVADEIYFVTGVVAGAHIAFFPVDGGFGKGIGTADTFFGNSSDNIYVLLQVPIDSCTFKTMRYRLTRIIRINRVEA